MSLSPFMCRSSDGWGQTDSSALGFANQTILGTKRGKCCGHEMSSIIPSSMMTFSWGLIQLQVSFLAGHGL